MTKLKGRDNVKQYLETIFGNNIWKQYFY
jgi:hypothetical protein